jgi:ribosomal protein S21
MFFKNSASRALTQASRANEDVGRRIIAVNNRSYDYFCLRSSLDCVRKGFRSYLGQMDEGKKRVHSGALNISNNNNISSNNISNSNQQQTRRSYGIGVVVEDGNVDRAMRRLKRTMINEKMFDLFKERLGGGKGSGFKKPSEHRVLALKERDRRVFKKKLKQKIGWILRRRERGF